jgi:shikimate dehydrogenase
MNEQRQALVSGTTRFIAILGDPVAQVFSPEVYNPRLAKAGADAVLIPLHVPSSAFETVMPALLRLGNLAGLIFTVPFKQRAIAFADRILPAGQQIGTINAMRRDPDGCWTADMFDGTGLVRALEQLDATPRDRRVLLIGAGGAGRAIAIALARAGAHALALFDLDQDKARHLADDVRRFYPDCAVTIPDVVDARGFEIIVNATPVGMAPNDGLPVPLSLQPGMVVFDIVPKPPMTPLLTEAARTGCRFGGGRLMIDCQADAVLQFLGFAS